MILFQDGSKTTFSNFFKSSSVSGLGNSFICSSVKLHLFHASCACFKSIVLRRRPYVFGSAKIIKLF